MRKTFFNLLFSVFVASSVCLAQDEGAVSTSPPSAAAEDPPREIPPADDNLVGQIRGQVFDANSGNFVIGATVTLQFPGAEAQQFGDEVPQERIATTDQRGRYSLQRVPAGIYKLEFFKEGYRPSVVSEVQVIPGEITNQDFAMPILPADEQTDVFELEAFEVSSAVLGQEGIALEALRKQSPASVDFLTSAEISKFGASDIAEAITRIPGVNVVDGQFAVIRGLNDRYVNTLVNGVPVPSTDPTRQGVQLDLFPSGFVDNLIVEKTFLPYLPGNSGGGSINIVTKDFPEEFTTSFKAGARFNSNAQDEYLRYNIPGSSYLFGTAKSSFAGVAPDTKSVSTPNTSVPFINNMNTPPVGSKFAVNLGDSFDALGRRVGYFFGGSYDSSYKTDIGTSQSRFGSPNPRPFFPNTIPPGFDDRLPNGGASFRPGSLAVGQLPRSSGLYQLTQSTGDVLIGGLGTVGIDLDAEGLNNIRAVAFISQNGTTVAQRRANGAIPPGQSGSDVKFNNLEIVGVPGGNDTRTLEEDILYYRERQLISSQVLGNHTIEELDSLKIDWALSFSKASQDEPDQRIFSYFFNLPLGVFENTEKNDFPNQLQRTWRSIDEEQYFVRADAEYPFTFKNQLNGKAQAGFFWEDSTRKTEQDDRFFDPVGTVRGATRQELGENFFNNSVVFNQGINAANRSEADTTRKITSAYAMVTLPIASDKLKVTGGARYEVTRMQAEGFGNFGTVSANSFWAQRPNANNPTTNGDILGVPTSAQGGAPEPGIIDDSRPLPGVTIVFEPIENFTLRGAYSQTIARPSFRELSPYFSRDFVTGDTVLGNPFLVLSEVESWDLRAEYIWDNGDLVAISGFYKNVENPIEQILLQDTQSRSTVTSFFNNPDRAIVKGVEIEMRKTLGFWDPLLDDFSLGANFTLIDASVGVPATIRDTFSVASVANPGFPAFSDQQFIPQNFFLDASGNVVGPPSERQLFDQPEYIVNADFTYSNPDIGTTLTVALYAQSQVLTAAGTGGNVGVPDQFTDPYYQLDVIFSQQITEGLQLKFSVKNITDTPRGISYDPNLIQPQVRRVRFKEGVDLSMQLEYTF